MFKRASAALFALAASAATAENTRQLDAHEHGVGKLDIAFDGKRIAMEFHAPGADIVGFEYAATSVQDRAAVDSAVATLARPLDLFNLPAAAGCSVVEASASLENEEHHDDHGSKDHEEDHDHKDHAAEANHTEFHAEYMLTCAAPEQATLITFGYFDSFPNARELEIQVITDRGATAFEVERAAPTLDLRGMF